MIHSTVIAICGKVTVRLMRDEWPGGDMSDRKKGVTIEKAVAFAARQTGLRIEDCAVGDLVEVKTVSTTYVLKVLDPAGRKVEVRGGAKHFLEWTTTYVNGSSMTGSGSMARLGWIGVGFRLWLGNILLSETQRITVNGQPFQVRDEDGRPKPCN